MEFSNTQLNRLRKTLIQDYGISLSDSELKDVAERLVRMAHVSYKHMFRRVEKKTKSSVQD